jgi:hypothetical protein
MKGVGIFFLLLFVVTFTVQVIAYLNYKKKSEK